ncbi:MAG: response regulator transcription factor, partial [Vicinamibacterales bacterium]
RALKSSDFLSQSELTRLGLYNEYIKPFFGTRYQIAIAVSAHRSRVIGISLARARRDFSERERQMLNALRPHLTQAVRHAETASKLPALSERSDEPESERQLVAIDLGGQIRSTTVTAETWLRQFFGRARSAHRLPEPVWRWVESRIRGRSHLDGTWDTGETLVARTPGARLTLRCVVRERGLFVMLEYDDPLRDALKLADLGLTPREIEILRWVAEGKATRDIAIIVGCSIRTAHKHLERIYRKLDVENRTAAAAVVRGLRRLDHSGP